MQWRPLKSERWKSSKRRTAKQKHQLANLHAKHHLNDENIPPPQDSLLIPSNRSHTGAIDALTHQLDTMDGTPFTRPEAVYAIQRISSDTVTYPHIRQLLASFLDGAMETWIRCLQVEARLMEQQLLNAGQHS